jgi:hypothetical protein
LASTSVLIRKRLIWSLLGIAAIGGFLLASYALAYHVHPEQKPGEFCALCTLASAPLLSSPKSEILFVALDDLGRLWIESDRVPFPGTLTEPTVRAPPTV